MYINVPIQYQMLHTKISKEILVVNKKKRFHNRQIRKSTYKFM